MPHKPSEVDPLKCTTAQVVEVLLCFKILMAENHLSVVADATISILSASADKAGLDLLLKLRSVLKLDRCSELSYIEFDSLKTS